VGRRDFWQSIGNQQSPSDSGISSKNQRRRNSDLQKPNGNLPNSNNNLLKTCKNLTVTCRKLAETVQKLNGNLTPTSHFLA
jgi:hypothetical protein